MLRRLTEHYNAFKDLNQTDWHRTVGDLIREKEKITGKSFKYCFVCCVKIHLQYCECSFEELKLILKTIPENERSNYYNNFNKIGRLKTPTKIEIKSSFNKEPSIPISNEILKLIEPLSSIGNIHIKFPDGDELIFKTVSPQPLLKRILSQLTTANTRVYSSPELESKVLDNGMPFKLQELKFYIDGDPTYSNQQQIVKDISSLAATIPNNRGVFEFQFSNGKRFIGSSKSMCRRTKEILNHLLIKKKAVIKWEQQVLLDYHYQLKIDDIKILYNECCDYKEEAKKLINQVDKNFLYNLD